MTDNLFNDVSLPEVERLRERDAAVDQKLADLHAAVCGLGQSIKTIKERLDNLEAKGDWVRGVWQDALVLIPEDEPNRFRLASVIAGAAMHGNNVTRIAEHTGLNWRTVSGELERAKRFLVRKYPEDVDNYLKYADAPQYQDSQEVHENMCRYGPEIAKQLMVTPNHITNAE